MLKVEYSKRAFLSVENFIIYLKNYYKKIYFDTGIATENLIISNYIEKTEELFDEICDKIESTLDKGVYGVITETKINFELSKLVIGVRSYNIVIIVKRYNNKVYIEEIIF